MYKPPVARSQLTKAEWLGGYIWAGHNMIVTMPSSGKRNLPWGEYYESFENE